MAALETRRLGDSDLHITRVGIGTAPIGSSPQWKVYWGPQDEQSAVRAIQTAIDLGVNWIDTAPFYGWGRAERIVGQAIKGDELFPDKAPEVLIDRSFHEKPPRPPSILGDNRELSCGKTLGRKRDAFLFSLPFRAYQEGGIPYRI